MFCRLALDCYTATELLNNLRLEVSRLVETSNATNLTLQGNYILIAFADFSLLLIHFVLVFYLVKS